MKTPSKYYAAILTARGLLSLLACLLALRPGAARAQWTLTQAPPQTWNAIACSPDGTRIVALYNGIWTSQDSGATWLSNNAPAATWTSVASSADGSRLVAASVAGSRGDIYVSDDGGTNWVKTSAPRATWRSVACSADRNRIIAASGGQVVLSKDGGGTWTTPPMQAGSWALVASSADGTNLYVSPGFSGTSGILASTNSGASWYYTAAPRSTWFSLACSADGSRVLALGGYLYISSDSGASWTQKNIPVGRQVAVSADGKTMIAVGWENLSTAEPGFVYASTDSGITWKDTTPPARSWNAIACSADGAKWVGAANVQTYVFERPPTPELAIRIADGATVLSWVVPSRPLVLEESAGTSSLGWSPVATSPTCTGYQNRVAVAGDGEARFYRLKVK